MARKHQRHGETSSINGALSRQRNITTAMVAMALASIMAAYRGNNGVKWRNNQAALKN